MKRAIIYTLVMLPTVLLVLPAVAGMIDAVSWIKGSGVSME